MSDIDTATPASVAGEGVENLADVFERAADLIEPEGRWTQGEEARNQENVKVNARAVAAGAIWAVARDPWKAVHALETIIPDGDIPTWNDATERTQAEVVAALREAAALARQADRA